MRVLHNGYAGGDGERVSGTGTVVPGERTAAVVGPGMVACFAGVIVPGHGPSFRPASHA